MTEQEHYERIDLPFYRGEIEPVLPVQILDFHAHIWRKRDWKEVPWEENKAGAKYMVTSPDYGLEKLQADSARIFPERTYKAVCFGNPTPAADIDKTDSYTAEAGKSGWVYPLMLAGKGLRSREQIEQRLVGDGFYGYKVLLNWYGNDYGGVTVADMIGAAEMELADKYHLVVLLHVPRSGRLADPEIQRGVRKLSRDYPNAQIVLAHCGRCYLPDQMKRAIHSIRDLDNVCMDTSMVMDPVVLQMVLEEIDSSRVLFATDFPVPAMRGRRVYVMDHWVDLVMPGNPESDFRVQSDNFRATFMVYEILLAIRRAAERVRLPQQRLTAIFFENGIDLLNRVRRPAV
ncbi:MAG: amidohydrolase family protein [Spirochaetales bacterium]|nr:amidohydrolase family protein [Spirochaetales bacterium]